MQYLNYLKLMTHWMGWTTENMFREHKYTPMENILIEAKRE